MSYVKTTWTAHETKVTAAAMNHIEDGIEANDSAIAANIITDNVSNQPVASVHDGANDMPVNDLVIGIEAVQGGSGDPSPTNVRAISGWTGANVVVSPTLDAQDGTTYPISWQTEAGTVYGGTLDVTTGVLTVTHALAEITSQTPIDSTRTNQNGLFSAAYNAAIRGIGNAAANVQKSNMLTIWPAATIYAKATENTIGLTSTGTLIRITAISNITSLQEYTAWLASLGTVQLWYPVATTVTYQLTPTEVRTLLGANNIFADTGDVLSLTYPCDTKLYIDKRILALMDGGD